MYCRHENDGVQKAEVKFINVLVYYGTGGT